ncbi:MAG: DUF1840 domain-containing protein [Burkholderiales bacterium]|nr:MAG: DUF1840 domain-containing protein [Burkholderiales bacterium]
MIYEFKSRATGNVIMHGAVGNQILELIDKEPGPKGIITVAQMPSAIERLEAAIARAKAEAATQGQDAEDADPNEVGFAQRAFPFVEMLKECLAAEKDIYWGV